MQNKFMQNASKYDTKLMPNAGIIMGPAKPKPDGRGAQAWQTTSAMGL